MNSYADVSLPPPQSTKHIRLRPVAESDAAYILSLRLNTQKNKYLSSVSDDVTAQQKWIRDYKDREVHRSEFYFIIESLDGAALGAVRVYDFINDDFSWGSWIIAPGAPSYVSIESALSVYEFAFNYCRFRKCHFQVVKGNKRVAAFHERFGALLSGKSETEDLYTFSLDAYRQTRKRYSKFLLG